MWIKLFGCHFTFIHWSQYFLILYNSSVTVHSYSDVNNLKMVILSVHMHGK